MKKKLASVLLAVLAAGGVAWFLALPDHVVSESAVLEGGVLGVSVAVPGTVRDVYVAVGEKVAKGQTLFALDSSDYETRLARERAKLVEIAAALPPDTLVPSPAARRDAVPEKPLATLRLEEEEAQQAVAAASHVFAAANIAYARFDASRGASATRDNAGKQKLLIRRDEAAISLKRARDAHEKASYDRARREAYDKALLAGKPITAALAARIAEYRAQVSRVSLAEQSLAATIVVSPEGGTVFSMAVTPGASLAAGDVPVTITPEKTEDLWVSAFFSPADAPALTVNRECLLVFPGAKGPVKGFIAALRPPSGTDKRIAAHIALDQHDAVSAALIGKDVSVKIAAGRDFFIPWTRKLP